MHDPSKYGNAKEGVTAQEYDEIQAQNRAMNQELQRRHAEREKMKVQRDAARAQVIADWQAQEKKRKEPETTTSPAASSKPEQPLAKEEAETLGSKKGKDDGKPKRKQTHKKDDDPKQASGETKKDWVALQYRKHGTKAWHVDHMATSCRQIMPSSPRYTACSPPHDM